MTPLNVISSYNIPTNSWLKATQYVMTPTEDLDYHRSGIGTLSKEEYEKRIAEVLRLDKIPLFDNQSSARICFGYTVQETIKAFNANPNHSIELLQEEVMKKTNALLGTNPWLTKDYVYTNNATPPKQKKISKKQLAIKLWSEKENPTSIPRKEWIALLVSELELTQAGASTYHANLKSGLWS